MWETNRRSLSEQFEWNISLPKNQVYSGKLFPLLISHFNQFNPYFWEKKRDKRLTCAARLASSTIVIKISLRKVFYAIGHQRKINLGGKVDNYLQDHVYEWVSW